MPERVFNERHKLERGSVVDTLLRILAGGGLLTMMVIMPNAIQALPTFIPQLRRKRYVQTTLQRLLDKNLIGRRRTKAGKVYFELTQAGRVHLAKYRLRQLKIKIPRRWDGKWRIVIFDISELRHSDRDRFRQQLINFGFHKLQNSVWVFPYDCAELIELLKTSYRLGKDVIYFIADGLNGDFELREKFDLIDYN